VAAEVSWRRGDGLEWLMGLRDGLYDLDPNGVTRVARDLMA